MKLATPTGDLEKIGQDAIPPDPAMLIRALRQIGYSFEQAIADLVDNSISADAKNVLVRFITDSDQIVTVVVADDGHGMSQSRLREAMKFGSELDPTRERLGKFGMGLKLASFSHAKSLTVFTRADKIASGRRWTLEGIEKGWECEQLSSQDAADELSAPWAELSLVRHGTLVIWDRIDKLATARQGLRETVKQLQKKLQVHLGLCFHRFIEGAGNNKQLRIFVDLQGLGQEEQPHYIEIRPLNPFGYLKSGHPDYPKYFKIDLEEGKSLNAEACIWPPNSDDEAYKLGNRAAARQGFYFYRNDRLIQAGGWSGLVQHDSEPHSSLARVRIEMPASLDADFGLNVQKSAVIVPPTFVPALAKAKADDGQSFDDYRGVAQRVYRKKDTRATKDHPLVPANGIPKAIVAVARDVLSDGSSKVRPVDISWTELADPGAVFDIDVSKQQILLNKTYRKDLLQGRSQGPADLAFIKMCIFFLMREDFERQWLSGTRRQRISDINAVLAKVLKLERSRG